MDPDAHDGHATEPAPASDKQPTDGWGPYAGFIKARLLACQESLERLEQAVDDDRSTRKSFGDQARLLLRGARHLIDECNQLESRIAACGKPALVEDEAAGPCRLLRGHRGRCDPMPEETLVQQTARSLTEFVRVADEAKVTFSAMAVRVDIARDAERQVGWPEKHMLRGLSERLHSLSIRASSLSVDCEALSSSHLPAKDRARLAHGRLNAPPPGGDQRLDPPAL